MNEHNLIIGMPAGSLANASRGGNLITLLESAGFTTKGYEAGGPSSFNDVSFYFGWDGRPQEFGSQLAIGELDVAIAGDDWIRERMLEMQLEYNSPIQAEKILSLRRGDVRIVSITRNDHSHNDMKSFLKELCAQQPLLTLVSEMPYLALDYTQGLLKELGLLESFSEFSVQKYKSPPRIQSGILIYETWGKTEAKVKNKGADFGLEITQSGSAIRNYGLRIMDTLMESETGIWINPAIRNHPEKGPLLEMFLINLYGSINAEHKVMIVFNVPSNLTASTIDFLDANSLFADEPTVNKGEDFSEFSIQVDTKNPKTPLARIRYELARHGAQNINTLPISSSIPGLSVLNFK
jgi:ATP phosphoribosyltransferase